MKKNKEIWEPIFTKFPDSTRLPEVYHPTEETDMKEPDTEYKLLLAERTIIELEKILNSQKTLEIKIFWLKQVLIEYKKFKKEMEKTDD